MAKSDRNSVISNFIWRFAERCGAQLVTFIVSIVLARILAPEDYEHLHNSSKHLLKCLLLLCRCSLIAD